MLTWLDLDFGAILFMGRGVDPFDVLNAHVISDEDLISALTISTILFLIFFGTREQSACGKPIRAFGFAQVGGGCIASSLAL